MQSEEVGRRWGRDPIVVTFEEGRGTVLHMMSHLYLQRGDVRDARDAQTASAYMGDALSMDAAECEMYVEEAGDLRGAEISSALRKQRIVSDWILGSRRKRRQRKEVPDER